MYKHKIGTETSSDELIYEESDPSYYLDIIQSKDKEYLMINCGSKSTNELHTIERDSGKVRCLISRKEDCRVFCNHVGNRFFVLTNKDLKTKE